MVIDKITLTTYKKRGLIRVIQKLSSHTNLRKCILYNQWDATYTVFFIIISALHVSAGFSAHHQELIKLYVEPQPHQL
jgi:hypothetical protein